MARGRNSRGYVWEKMYVAVSSMCGRSTLEERIYNATISALARLNDDDLDGELGEDLKYVLQWTKHNMADGVAKKAPDDVELSQLIEKMLRILEATQDERAVP
jgi:hypothetical protein